jgi:hypothetical protein
MDKPLSRGFVIGWYCFCAVLIAFYVLNAPLLAHMASVNDPKGGPPYAAVIAIDTMGVFPALYLPVMWNHGLTHKLRVVFVACVIVLVLGTAYPNILAWR